MRAWERGRAKTPDEASARRVAGSSAHVGVLALQRVAGNRAASQLLRSRRPAGRVLQRALRGMSGVLSGRHRPLDEWTGRWILSEFARNDPRSVGSLVGEPFEGLPAVADKDVYMLDAGEWGLIKEKATEEVHLIEGGSRGVIWGRYIDQGSPLAHSHPWRQGRLTRSIGRDAIRIEDLFTGSAGSMVRLMVLPTVSDLVVPARQKQSKHTVFTPYAIDTHGNVHDPAQEEVDAPSPMQGGDGGRSPGWRMPASRRRAPRLTWEITHIHLDEANHQVTGLLTAMAGGTAIGWSRIQADSSDANLASVEYDFLATAPGQRPPASHPRKIGAYKPKPWVPATSGGRPASDAALTIGAKSKSTTSSTLS